MNDSKYYGSYKKLQYESSYINKEDSPCHGIENISIFVRKNKTKLRKAYPYKVLNYTQPTVILIKKLTGSSKSRKSVTRHASMPEINKINIRKRAIKLNTKSSNAIPQSDRRPTSTKYLVSELCFKNNFNSFKNSIDINQRNFKVYRCQVTANNAENCNNCCCSCNSDTMFEVMKDLYDCYKKRNCDNCNCILCCNVPMEERFKETSKPCPEINLESALKEVAMKGFALPEGKTTSEKELIDTIRNDLGLPPEPMSQDMRDKYTNAANTGLMLPLEGKSPKQKEKILRDLHGLGIPLPVGRTPSEKSLIGKILGKGPQRFETLADNIQDAKRSGLLQIKYEGKSPDEIEKILKDVAMRGIPLPETDAPLLKNMIGKVRADLGLPPEPKTPSMREKHKKAAEAGLLLPLEGKSPEEKELILQGLENMKIPLPQGRTPSEKALIAKVKKRQKLEEKTASNIKEGEGPVDECICELLAPRHLALLDKKRKAKAAGLLTPIRGKSKGQKEKILKGLALRGFPLPKGETASDGKLIKKVRADLGLPPEPKSSAMRVKYAKAVDDGILLPLEGKSPKEKEKILKDLHARGIPLPKGRTPSEKALVNKILKESHTPSTSTISAKKPKEKAAKPLDEKKLRDLAMKGLPLPEGKTESDNKLLTKVRAELGLPPEPKTPSIRNKYEKAAEMGLMQPLEGKSLKEKETILRGLANVGIPLPKGRTPSENALIARIKGEPRDLSMLLQSKEGMKVSLEGKTPAEKEKILRDMALEGIPLPKGKTESETQLIIKVRNDLGLPPEPKSSTVRNNYEKAAKSGLLLPLEGQTLEQKERILRGLLDRGIALPEGRTPSEKSLIRRLQIEFKTPSEKIRNAKDAGLLTPLEGKSPSQQEEILRGLAMMGMPLPKGNTASQNKLISKVRIDLGLPPEPKRSSLRNRYAKAADIGLLQPLEGKTPKQKEKILRNLIELNIPLPKGRTPSEQALIDKVQREKSTHSTVTLTEKMRAAKAAGLLTPLKGKTPAQKEKILKGLAKNGIPLPEGKTQSEKDILHKVRLELGLPPEPKTSSIRDKYAKAADAGILVPLEGKTHKEKEKILRQLADAGIPLPKARTPSEKALIDKIKGEPRALSVSPSEKINAAKAAGLLTPLKGKTPAEKEKILRGLAEHGIPLPEGKTKSEKDILYKLRLELGLPPEPKTSSIRDKYAKAADAGIIVPLEGKTHKEKEKILRQLADAGIPLPKARTPSEKALIDKIKGEPRTLSKETSEKMRKAHDAGLLTPLTGKSPAQKEKILQGRANLGIPLPEGKTSSEKNILNKIRRDLGLPPEPKTPAVREKHEKAAAAGLLVPLEGKSPKEKQKIIEGLADMGIPLPEGRTDSEKKMIAKVKERAKASKAPEPSVTTEKLRKAKAAGLLTPLDKKSPEEKERILRNLAKVGLPLPEGKTRSEKSLINQIKKDYGFGKESSTDKIRKAKAAGFLTPLDGKTPEQKEKILRGRAAAGLPLPKGKSRSEKDLINKIKASTGYVTPSPSGIMEKAEAAGLLSPLDGKTPSEKEKYLRQMAAAGIPLPAGKTPSEKDMIKKLNAIQKSKSDKVKAAKASSQLTTLKGKPPEQKEKILKGFVKDGVPLPEGKTPSEKILIDKIRLEMGLPPAPKTPSMREKYKKAQAAGIITPLEGKTLSEKENILRKLQKEGIPLPVGRTPSEKILIKTVKAGLSEPSTPFEDMTPEKKEKLLRGLIKAGESLPDAKTPSGKELIEKVRKDMGLPPEPKSISMKEKMRRAHSAGLITPLEGKTPAQKENILRNLAEAGIPLPEGRTASEKALKRKIEAEVKKKPDKPTAKEFKKREGPSEEIDEAGAKTLSSKLKKADKLGLNTPLEGKSPEEKERIVRELAKLGLPLPEGTTKSDKQLITNIRIDLGLPPSPETSSMKKKYDEAAAAGVLLPLEGLTPAEKEKVLRSQAKIGLPLPEGRTPSEKLLINKVKGVTAEESKEAVTKPRPSKLKKAKEHGLLTPLEGKSPEEKERILRELAKLGLPLPEGTTKSDKQLITNIRLDLGLPPSPETSSMKKKYDKAAAAGVLLPLEGLTPVEKEKILRSQAKIGLPLPQGRTPSEKSLINKIKGATAEESKEAVTKPRSSKLRKAKELGLLTPLEGKTPAEKERILRELAKLGLPLPEGTTKSEKQLLTNIRLDLGLPPSPETSSMKKREAKAAAGGVLLPLEGLTPAEKEKVLRAQANIGLPLPKGRTPSEISLINKIKEEVGSKVSPAKIRKTKDVGLTTPLKGKSTAEKDKAKEPGLFTPLAGKTSAEKEKILQGLADAGLPLPEGNTSTERALVRKVREETKKTKSESKRTCERGCGCDKKKIRFKHSYVKIRVTSPDISSLCPCPNECISGVKGGVFLDNDGINVIIERAGDIPQYKQSSNNMPKDSANDSDERNSIDKFNYVTDPVPMYFGVKCKNCSNLLTSMYEDHSLKCSPDNNCQHSMTDTLCTYFSLSDERCLRTTKYTNELRKSSDNRICPIGEDHSHSLEPSHNSKASDLITYLNNPSTVTTCSSRASFDSIIIIKSETSLSFSTSYEEINSSSAISSRASAFTLKSNPYSLSFSNLNFNDSTIAEPEFLTNGVKYCAVDTNTRHNLRSSAYNKHDRMLNHARREYIIQSTVITSKDKNIFVNRNQMPDDVVQVFPMSSTKLSTVNQTKCNIQLKDDVREPVIIITNLNSDLDITSVVDDIISKKEFSEASSLFVVVPSDEEENEICCNSWKNENDEDTCSLCGRTSSKIEDLRETKRGNFFFEKVPTTIVSSINNKGNLYNYVKHGPNWLSGNKICQITAPNAMFHRCHVVSTDTTQDRPCCCGTGQVGACTTNVMSEVIRPEFINQAIRSNKSIPRKNNIQQPDGCRVIESPTMSVGQISECYRYPGPQPSIQNLKYPLSSTEPRRLEDGKQFLSSTMNKISKDVNQLDYRNNDSPTEHSTEESLLGTTSVTPVNENYLICHQQKLKKIKLPKWVSGEKAIRIDTTCDCKHQMPSFIMTREEDSEKKMHELSEQCCAVHPNRTKSSGQVISRCHRTARPPVIRPGSLVSIGVQDSPGCILCLSGLPCTSEHNVSGHITSLSNVVFQQTPVNIYGHSKHQSTLSPLRSYAAIGSGGIYTQKGSKPIPYSMDAGVGVDFKNVGTGQYKYDYLNKQIQKNSSPYPQSALRTKPIQRHMHRDNEVVQNKITLMKPNITQTTSRVNLDNNIFFKQQIKAPWTIEDIIRYYAKFKPEVLQTLISLTSVKKPVVRDIKEAKYVRNQQPGESSRLSYLPESQTVPTRGTHELESRPFAGFKIEKPGKSSGPKSLTNDPNVRSTVTESLDYA